MRQALGLTLLLGLAALASPAGAQRTIDADAANVSAPAANTAATLTFAAVTGRRHHMVLICYSYNAAPTNGRLFIEDPAATTVFDLAVTAAGEKCLPFIPPLRGEISGAVVVTLAAGGAAVTGRLNVYKYTE